LIYLQNVDFILHDFCLARIFVSVAYLCQGLVTASSDYYVSYFPGLLADAPTPPACLVGLFMLISSRNTSLRKVHSGPPRQAPFADSTCQAQSILDMFLLRLRKLSFESLIRRSEQTHPAADLLTSSTTTILPLHC
jgi:hypothetical protein